MVSVRDEWQLFAVSTDDELQLQFRRNESPAHHERPDVLLASSAAAQTSSGQLTITMNVQSSITLIFQNNPSVGTTGFCPLTMPARTMLAWILAQRLSREVFIRQRA